MRLFLMFCFCVGQCVLMPPPPSIAMQIQPQGERLLSIAVTPPAIDDYSRFWEVYENALDLAIATGADLPGELVFAWNNTEQKNLFGKITYTDANSLRLIEMLKARDLPVVISLTPLETLENRIPGDLQDKPLNDPQVVARFKRFIDWVYEVTIELEVVAVNFGNEFDVYIDIQKANGDDQWMELEGLVVATKEHVKSLPRWKDTPFSLEPTFGGLTGSSWQDLQRINKHADIIGVSYYPMNGDTVHDPAILGEHLQQLFRLYPDKKIDFYQYGYPSSESINGSLEKQKKFVEDTFRYWDTYKDKIRIITFTWLYDVQPEVVDAMVTQVAGYVTPEQAFLAFLGSLGLHGTHVGDEKPAFKALKKQIEVRGW